MALNPTEVIMWTGYGTERERETETENKRSNAIKQLGKIAHGIKINRKNKPAIKAVLITKCSH